MTKVIILAGKAGSGKDTLKRLLVQYMEQDGMQLIILLPLQQEISVRMKLTE